MDADGITSDTSFSPGDVIVCDVTHLRHSQRDVWTRALSWPRDVTSYVSPVTSYVNVTPLADIGGRRAIVVFIKCRFSFCDVTHCRGWLRGSSRWKCVLHKDKKLSGPMESLASFAARHLIEGLSWPRDKTWDVLAGLSSHNGGPCSPENKGRINRGTGEGCLLIPLHQANVRDIVMGACNHSNESVVRTTGPSNSDWLSDRPHPARGREHWHIHPLLFQFSHDATRCLKMTPVPHFSQYSVVHDNPTYLSRVHKVHCHYHYRYSSTLMQKWLSFSCKSYSPSFYPKVRGYLIRYRYVA